MKCLLTLIALTCLVVSAHCELKPVPKAVNTKVYAHLMPWFETRQTSGNGQWGIHWTMDTQNPDIVDSTGRRQIAAHYYPEIGPYASGDPYVIEYQFNLMRYAGIDGILLDWPGTLNVWDYPTNFRNSEEIIRRTAQFGLEFAIVYEDHNIGMAYDAGLIGDKLQAGRQDMSYISNNYFTRPNHIHVNGNPLLLVFGPQTFYNPSDWGNVFSALSRRPTFLTLWYQEHQAAGYAYGEYPWIYHDFLTGLNHFYQYHQVSQVKFGVGYPGFHTFYAQGGWDGPQWSIPHRGVESFSETLDAAIRGNVGWIQLATWNDYGEGTMIEPTREFGNGFLNVLQRKLGVPFGDRELNLAKSLYEKRQQYRGQEDMQLKLDKVAAALLDLEPNMADDLLKDIN